MNLSSLTSRVSAPEPTPDRLAEKGSLSESQKIGEAGRQFEAVLLRQILGDAMKPAFKSKFISTSAQSGIYQDMVVNQLADTMTHSGGLGLADSLNHQLTRQLSSAPKPTVSTVHE